MFDLVIGFRDRGGDPYRKANLDRAIQWWREFGIEPIVVDDGRSGDAQWNRSAAYNRAAGLVRHDVVAFIEADLLVPIEQLITAAEWAEEPGLVIPFSQFLAMNERDSDLVRQGLLHPSDAIAQQMRGDRQSIGAGNVVSRESLMAIGRFDEGFEGHAFDDDATERAFAICCGPTRFVDGPAWHQFHTPGALYRPDAPDSDRQATAANEKRYQKYLAAETPDDIWALTMGEAEEENLVDTVLDMLEDKDLPVILLGAAGEEHPIAQELWECGQRFLHVNSLSHPAKAIYIILIDDPSYDSYAFPRGSVVFGNVSPRPGVEVL